MPLSNFSSYISTILLAFKIKHGNMGIKIFTVM